MIDNLQDGSAGGTSGRKQVVSSGVDASSHGGFQPQSLGRVANPTFAAIRLALVDRTPDRLDLRFCLGVVDQFAPTTRAGQRPGAEELTIRRGPVLASPQARPSPTVGRSDEVRTHCVALGVPRNLIEVVVHFDRERQSPRRPHSSKASQSRSLLNKRIRPTPRFNTWKTIPPRVTRAVLGIPEA